MARQFDEDNVPQEGRFLFISPYIRSILRHEQDIFNRDFNDGSVAGTLNTRTIGVLEGFQLILTNNLPGDWTGTTNGRYNLIDTNFAKYDFECGLYCGRPVSPCCYCTLRCRHGSACYRHGASLRYAVCYRR